ncbi:MAG: TadE/TadG family type IV pilus assembly protein [Candidatus Acidiferrales bacterium]
MSTPSTHAVFEARHRRFSGRLWRESRGSQLAELALVLPILLLFIAGISDFATAFNTRQILNNAAREGARLGASESPLDLYAGGTPPSIAGISDVVQNYLTDGGLQYTNAGVGPCTFVAPPTQVNLQFTFASTCPNVSLVIDRAYTTISGDGVTRIQSTHVTITYPYHWYMVRVFGLRLIFRLPVTLSSDAVMQNTP